MMKLLATRLSILLLALATACQPAASTQPAATLTPIREIATKTPILDGPAATRTPFEQVATMLPAVDAPAPMVTIPPTPGDTGLYPSDSSLQAVTFDTLDLLAIPPATYTDAHAGFALDYPAAWQVTAPAAPEDAAVYSSSIISFARVTPGPKQQEGIPEGHAKIEIVVIQDRDYTFEEAVDSQRKQSEQEMPTKLLLDEGWLLPSGLPARRWAVEGMAGQVNILITAIDGRKVIIAGYGEPGLFNVIAGSLRAE